jgi:hypothetical protein
MKGANFCPNCFHRIFLQNVGRKWVGLRFRRCFSQAHLVTLAVFQSLHLSPVFNNCVISNLLLHLYVPKYNRHPFFLRLLQTAIINLTDLILQHFLQHRNIAHSSLNIKYLILYYMHYVYEL